jgi:hypothetical protein
VIDSLAPGEPLTAERREQHDQGRPWAIAWALGVLGVYVYLLTGAAALVGLPTPESWLRRFLPSLDFRDGGAVDAVVDLAFTRGGGTGRLSVMFAVIVVAFLSGYFAPMAWKKACHVGCALVGIAIIYGGVTTALLVGAHLVIFVTLHPAPPKAPWAAVAAVLLSFGFDGHGLLVSAGAAGGAGLVGWALYFWGAQRLLASRAGAWVRWLAVQSPLLTIVIGSAVQGLGGGQWSLPLGLLMFFWQWERLIMYRLDQQSGNIPAGISIIEYLAVFVTPAVLPKWQWGATLGQGYAYLQNVFYSEDKNRLVRSGAKLMGIALLYLLFSDWVRFFVSALFEGFGVPAYQGRISAMVERYLDGGQVSTASVLVTSWLDILRWMALWAGAVHFKVGVWQILGYKVAPYFDKPLLATNLVDLWTRYTFHYREFISQAFYYPAFFKAPRFIRRNLKVRIVVATFFAAAYGNLVWGHIPEGGFYHGLRWEEVLKVLSSWPYFILLGVLISATELYLMSRGPRTRAPWTGGPRILIDVLCVYLSVQAYGLIHIFNRVTTLETLPKLGRLFLVGLGFPG